MQRGSPARTATVSRGSERARRTQQRAGADLTARRSAREYLRLHWSEANRFPGAVWSVSALLIGLVAPFAVVTRCAGFPGAWPPVWLPLLDPALHAVASVALIVYFCRREHLDSWHLGLDRARIDAAAGWTLGALVLALGIGAAALTDPGWVARAPEIFAPARDLLRAAEFEPGLGTRILAGLFALSGAGPVSAAEEIILTGLLYPTLRRRWPVLPCALACAAAGALLHARPTECGVDPCLWPAAQAAAAQATAALVAALAYEGLRTLWIPIVLQAGFVLMRMAPGLPAVLLS